MKNHESLSHTRYDCKYPCCLYPVLCQNLIHLQRYKRTVDAAWEVRPATTIEQSYPLDGSSPCR